MKDDQPHHPDDDVECYHVVPAYDLKEHVASAGCWCRPELDPDDDAMIYIHNPLDGRDRRLN